MKTFLNQFAQNPDECLVNNIRKQKFPSAFIGYALGVISVYFAIKLNSLTQATLGSFLATCLFWFFFNILINFILAALANLFLEFAGYQSKASGIFIILGLSQFILTLLVPCYLIKQAFSPATGLMPLFWIGIIFLQIYFILAAMKKTFELSKTVSVLAFILSFLFPFLAGFGLVAFLISLFIVLFP